jgi:hypothetical protein
MVEIREEMRQGGKRKKQAICMKLPENDHAPGWCPL